MSPKQKVLDVMKANHLCVLSSLGTDGEPQSAIVGFAEDENGWLVIGTSKLSRKYQNITHDPRVSIVIGWDERKTVQYQGLASEAFNGERDKYCELHVSKHPSNARFKNNADNVYFLIKPTWVRFTDTSVLPWEITEAKEMLA